MKSRSELTQKGIFIDIDDTLVDTSVACAQELWQRKPLTTFSSSLDVLTSYGMPEQVPEWQTPECKTHMHHMLTDVKFLAKIPEIPLAGDAVRHLAKTHPVAGYLTSRLPFAFDVTTKWLSDRDFPQAPVIYRFPDTTEKDWKIRFIERNFPNSLGIIDNELYVPEVIRYTGKLVELMRFRLLSPFDERKIICHNWHEVWRVFSS